MKKIVTIGLTLFSLVIVGVVLMAKQNIEKDNRPEYCDSNGCVPKEVFKNLPPMPDDFFEKWALVYYNRISDLDIIPEEYWKQPEFYAYVFKEQCMQYYTVLDKKEKVMYFSSGSGPYPADSGVSNVSTGDNLKFTTFWHTGCAIARFQVFSLGVNYPEEMNVRMKNIKVNQNPETAMQCFNISIKPDYVFLNPSYPIFGYNHTQKVSVDVSVNDGCPIGEYGLEIFPIDPPQDVLERLEYEYGFRLSSMRTGGVWNIYIKVEH